MMEGEQGKSFMLLENIIFALLVYNLFSYLPTRKAFGMPQYNFKQGQIGKGVKG